MLRVASVILIAEYWNVQTATRLRWLRFHAQVSSGVRGLALCHCHKAPFFCLVQISDRSAKLFSVASDALVELITLALIRTLEV